MLFREDVVFGDWGTGVRAKANRLYKDRLFRMIFGNEKYKEYALSLYNALAGRNYSNPADLEFTTIDNIVYMSMKNDVSFIIDGQTMTLWEQQSTPNENMPLRGFIYFGILFEGYIYRHKLNLYNRKMIMIPSPRYIVLYNGTDEQPAVRKMKLSDAFMIRDPECEGEFEWTATMVNINRGKNPDLLKKCPILNDYMTLVNRVNDQLKEGKSIEDSVDEAVKYCIDHDILNEFLQENREEVLHVCLTEFNEIEWEEAIRQEERTEGRILEAFENYREFLATDSDVRNKVKNKFHLDDRSLEQYWNLFLSQPTVQAP